MTIRLVTAMAFSPTGTTRRVVSRIADLLSAEICRGQAPAQRDFTLPGARREGASFGEGELVVFGVPVYGGRVPRVLLEYLTRIRGNDALAVALAVYGNRDYDDALIELSDLLGAQGFLVAAAAAFIGEHSYSRLIAPGRPDEEDMRLADEFAARVARKLSGAVPVAKAVPKGNRPYRALPVPRDERGEVIDLGRAKPQTSPACQECGVCVEVCPMGAIDHDDVSAVVGECIRCNACVKTCPSEAKSFADGGYLTLKRWLESRCLQRREPEFFL